LPGTQSTLSIARLFLRPALFTPDRSQVALALGTVGSAYFTPFLFGFSSFLWHFITPRLVSKPIKKGWSAVMQLANQPFIKL